MHSRADCDASNARFTTVRPAVFCFEYASFLYFMRTGKGSALAGSGVKMRGFTPSSQSAGDALF